MGTRYTTGQIETRVLTVVLRPPGEVAAADDVVEDERDDRPGDVVDRTRGRDVADAREDDGEVDVLDDAVRPLERDGVRRAWEEGADEEEVEKGVVHRSGTKESSRTDTTPEKCGSCKRRRTRTDESVFLVRRTEIGDVGEHPFLYTNSYEYRNNCCSDLSEEHDPRWDFHVVT